MANCINYNCDETLGAYNENECGKILPGGTNAVYILECDHEITDPSDESQLATAVAAGKATLITGATISIDKPSPNLIESGVSCKPAQLVSYSRTGTYYNDNVSGPNINFHRVLFGGKQIGGILAYECGAADAGYEQITWIDSRITLTGGRVLPSSNKEAQRFEGDLAWEDLDDAMIYEAPTNFLTA